MAIEEARHAARRARPSSSTRSPTACSGPTCRCSARSPTAATSSSNTTPGCWGPMITPSIRGGHEVVPAGRRRGRRVGDAIAIRINDIEVTSLATASGNDQPMEGRFNGDPYCAPVCPGCGAEWPRDARRGHRPGVGPLRELRRRRDAVHVHQRLHDRVRRDALGRRHRRPARRPRRIARDAARVAALPDNSRPEPDPAVRAARPRRRRHAAAPVPRPARHVAVDDDPRLPQRRRLRLVPGRRAAPLRARRAASCSAHKTDGHMDIDAVRAGAILVCPVKVDGGGVYLGDMHALQGDGEIAGHTCDVSGTVTLEVEVIKGLGIDGPVLFPLAEDLPFLARPLTADERARAPRRSPRRHGVDELEESLPISVVGTGPDLNSATDNGLARAAELLGMTVPEVHEPRDDHRRDRDRPPPRRRAGDVPRARRPARAERGLLGYAEEQYGEA